MKLESFYFSSVRLEPETVDAKDDASKKEIQLLKVGRFVHPGTSRAVEITPEHLMSFVKNFEANVRGIQLAVGYEHGQSMAHGTKAAGWIESLTIKGGDKELWAKVNWNPPARDAIKNGEFRYISAEISFDYLENMGGRKVGPALLGATLTNYPVVKGMAAVAASEFGNNETKENKPMNLPELKVKLSEFGIDLSELEKKAKRTDELETQLSETKTILAASENKVKDLSTKVTELSETVAKRDKEVHDSKFKDLSEKGMRDGKLTKAMAEGSFKEMCDKMGLEFGEKFLKDAAKVVDLGEPKGGEGKDKDKKYDDAAHELADLAEARATKDKISFSEAAKLVMKEKPELAKEYANLGA